MSSVIRYSISSKKSDQAQRVVQDLTAAPDLTPTANYKDADVYVKPRAPELQKPTAESPFTKLAESIAEASPELNKYLTKAADDQNKETAAQAQLVAAEELPKIKEQLQKNQLAWADVVQERPDLQTANPWFLKGYRRAFLDSKASEAAQAFDSEYTQNGALKSSLDPNAYTDFAAKFRQKLVEGNQFPDIDALEVKEHFMDKVDKHLGDMGLRHAHQRDQEFVKARGELMGQEIYNMTGQLYDKQEWSDPLKRTERTEAYAAKLQEIADKAQAEGLLPTQINEHILKYVRATAIQFKDATLLDALDLVKTRKDVEGAFLGKTGEAQLTKIETRRQIDAEDDAERRRKHQRALDDFNDKVLPDIFANGHKQGYNLTASMTKLGIDLKGLTFSDLSTAQALVSNLQGAREERAYNPARAAQVLADLAETGDMRPALRALNNGTLRKSDAGMVAQVKSRADDDLRNGYRQDVRELGGTVRDYFTMGNSLGNDADTQAKAISAQRYAQAMLQDELDAAKAKGPLTPNKVMKIRMDVEDRVKAMPRFMSDEFKARVSGPQQGSPDVMTREKVNGEHIPTYTPSTLLQNPDAVTKMPPTKVKYWNNNVDLEHDIQVFERSGTGVVKQIADHLGLDPVVLLKTQAAHFGVAYETPEEKRVRSQQEAEARAAQGKKGAKKASKPDPIYAAPGQPTPLDGFGPAASIGKAVDDFVDWARMTPEQREAATNKK